MRRLVIIGLAAAQLAGTAQPAVAAELIGDGSHVARQRDAFAGARFQVPLGGTKTSKPRLGLTLAPLVRTRGQDGSLSTRYGQGLELGLAGKEPVRLSFGGRSVSQLVSGREGPQGRKLGVSTVGWVAIAVGVVAVSYVSLYALCGSGTICNTDDE